MTTTAPHRRKIPLALARRDQRGASVLVVFLVLTMLVGIGMYAARSATLSTDMAGSTKQLEQTRDVTEYALVNALARDTQSYVARMPQYQAAPNDLKCFGFASVPNATCYPFGYQELESVAGVPLVIATDTVNHIPGSLGPGDLQADFVVDMTDLMPASPPVPGEALNADSPVKVGYFSVTLTATGQIRPRSDPAKPGNVPKDLAATASLSKWRAHVVVGPIPNPAPRPFVP